MNLCAMAVKVIYLLLQRSTTVCEVHKIIWSASRLADILGDHSRPTGLENLHIGRGSLTRAMEPNKEEQWELGNMSLNNTFVNFLLPQLQSEGDTRRNAKKRFENWRQIGRACTKPVESFGVGILLLLPRDLWDENLRELEEPQEDALIAYLDSSRPCLKTDIKNLASFLSALTEDRCLPTRTMMLEVLNEGEITSGELEIRSLRELLEYSDNVNYASYLTDEALTELSQNDSDAPPHLPVVHQAGSCVDLPSLGSSDDPDPGSISSTGYLLSPTNGKRWIGLTKTIFAPST